MANLRRKLRFFSFEFRSGVKKKIQIVTFLLSSSSRENNLRLFFFFFQFPVKLRFDRLKFNKCHPRAKMPSKSGDGTGKYFCVITLPLDHQTNVTYEFRHDETNKIIKGSMIFNRFQDNHHASCVPRARFSLFYP